MRHKRAVIYLDVTCCVCGSSYPSRDYKNASTISTLKKEIKDWIFDDDWCGNVCPECQGIKNKDNDDEQHKPSAIDMWNTIQSMSEEEAEEFRRSKED